MRTPPERIIIAVTGASGSIYVRLLVERLLQYAPLKELALVFSRNGKAVSEYEGQTIKVGDPRVRLFDNDDMFAAPASGSAGYDAMAVVPCSMGTVGRIAGGISDSLICRAADVMLKERRTLILVPRETPYSTIHLRNLTAISESGGIILPASPSFYSLPGDIEQVCMTVVERIMSLMDIRCSRFQWGENFG